MGKQKPFKNLKCGQMFYCGTFHVLHIKTGSDKAVQLSHDPTGGDTLFSPEVKVVPVRVEFRTQDWEFEEDEAEFYESQGL